MPGPRPSGSSSIGAASRSKKTAHAAEQNRIDVLASRRAWFQDQLDFDPARLIFIDETGLSTKMARLRGRAPRGERCVAAVPHGHVWTPPPRQEFSSDSHRVIGCSHVFGLSCAAVHEPRARMGVRRSDPHHWNALHCALTMRLVFPTPPRRRHAILVLRPPTSPPLSRSALRRARPELYRCRPWPSAPRRCAPSCWPTPR